MLLWLTLCAGCADVPREAHPVLDARTGTTITVAGSPVVLARERRDLAVQARDYLTLLAAEINVTGSRQLVLVAHQWSTIDVRAGGPLPAAGTPLLLVADGRDLLLQPAQAPIDVKALGKQLARPEDAVVSTSFYAIDPESLRYWCSATQVAAAFPGGAPPLPFSLWRDGRAAQLGLLEAIGR